MTAVGRNVLREELALPLCTLRDGALRANSRALPAFLAELGGRCGAEVVLSPHGKTSMIKELWQRQLDDGCWAITTANARQTRVAREAGVRRILVANQLVGRAEIDWVLAELRADDGFELCCFVDSVDGAERLVAGMEANEWARPLAVLLETGYAGGRCGVRTLEDGMRVARAVASTPQLRLAGVACYEGLLQTRRRGVREREAGDVLRFCVEVAEACAADGCSTTPTRYC
jgi:D-serine dehydratase